MGKLSQIPLGARYNKLTILTEEPHLSRPNGKMKRMVKVKCDCGEVVVKSWQDVKHSQQKSCGLCKKELPYKDISGARVGRLTIQPTFQRVDGIIHWDCKCDCGSFVVVDGRKLRENRIVNCGGCGTPMGAYYWGQLMENKEGRTSELLNIENDVVTLKDILSQGVFTVKYSNLKNGGYSNPFHPSVVGVGYFGVGEYIAKGKGCDRHTLEYEDWNSMMKRCYVKTNHNLSYRDKEVSEEWHNYQVFAGWVTKQPNFGRKDWHLDKDLLVKGNTLYSPDTCVYLPREINSFIKRKRCNDLPLGVDIAYEYNGTPYFRVQAREDGKNIVLGKEYNVEKAFTLYKNHKEGLAKKLADKWKTEIPLNAYNALINYTVDIND